MTLICLGAGLSQVPVLAAAKKLGRSVVAVDRNPQAPGFAYADASIHQSTHDTPAVLTALWHLRERFHYSGILARTTAPEALNTAVAIAREFALPGLTADLVKIATEKATLREFCHRHDLPAPWGTRVNGCLDNREVPGLPVIVKPDSTRVGKANIRLCRDMYDLPRLVAEAQAVSNNQQVEVAAYLEGFDATCLCWAHLGQARIITWWDELVVIDQDDRVLGLGVSVPSVVTGTKAQRDAERLMERLVPLFPGVDALLLISCRFTWDGMPYLIEVHADLGGDAIAEVLWPAAQLQGDFFEMAIQIAEGSLTQPATPAWQPTALFYGPEGSCFGQATVAATEPAILMQRGELKKNLESIQDIVASRQLLPRRWPGHLHWFEGNRP